MPGEYSNLDPNDPFVREIRLWSQELTYIENQKQITHYHENLFPDPLLRDCYSSRRDMTAVEKRFHLRNEALRRQNKWFRDTGVNDIQQYVMSLSSFALEKASRDFILGAPMLKNLLQKKGISTYFVDDMLANSRLLTEMDWGSKILGNGAFVFCAINTFSSIENDIGRKNYGRAAFSAGELFISYYATYSAGPIVGLIIGGAYLIISIDIAAIKRDIVEIKKRQALDKIRETGYLPYALNSELMSFNQGEL